MLSGAEQDQIIELAKASFGRGYLTTHQLQAFDSERKALVVLEKTKEMVTGFSIVQLIEKSSFSEALFLPDDWEHRPLCNDALFGYRKMTAVKSTEQEKGIGQRLVSLGDGFLAKNASQIFSTVWQSGQEMAMLSLLQKSGYLIVDTIDNYWSADSSQKQYNCPKCGAPPCTCSAIILKKQPN